MVRDPYKYFRIEARELLDQLSRGTLDLEKGANAGVVAQLLRLAHTLKGAARVVKCLDIGDWAHAIEDTLEPLRGAEQQATKAQIDTLLRYLDDISGSIAALAAPAPVSAAAMQSNSQSTPQSAPQSTSQSTPLSVPKEPVAAHAGTEEVLRTIRVDVGEMDTLLGSLAEVHARVGSLRDCQRQIAGVRDLANSLSARLALRSDRAIDLRGDAKDVRQAQDFAARIGESYDKLQHNFTAGIEQLDRELRQVRDAAERMRLIPSGSLFVSLERAARDAAQLHDRQIVFEGHGGAVRLDAQVLEIIQSALAHAVRNAVVHGIEALTERLAAGKPALGKVSVDVSQRGSEILFRCIDDGRGIDLNAIRRMAEQRGLLTVGAHLADDDTLLQLLLKGGISTAGKITEVAGRGVGLDVVRDAIEQLHGKIDLHTEPGRGTTLTLAVPLSIAALEGLQVESAGVITTIPLDAVSRTLRIVSEDIARTAQGESLLHEGQSIPFLPLVRTLSNTVIVPRSGRAWSVVVVKADGHHAAIGVDRLLGVTNVVLRPLPALAPAKAVVAGVSLDMEGNAQLVLDPQRLILAARHASVSSPAQEESRVTILVVDDSLTTRMLERSILESAGYNVELAVSGEEAMEKASRNRYALFLVDVEMPGMDGFTFIERTRADPALRDIPAILVTSLAAPEDLRRGKDVGASGYIVKSEFDQGFLLKRIGELVR